MLRGVRELYRSKKLVFLLLTPACTFLFFWFSTYVLRNFNSSEAVDSQINFMLLFTTIASVVIYLFFIGLRFKVDVVYALTLGLVIAYLSTSTMLINVDRSRSFYVLSWINEYKFPSVESQRSYDMVRSSENLAEIPINQRIEEQVRRGFVTSHQGILVLTFKGEAALIMAELLASNFRLKGWYKNKY